MAHRVCELPDDALLKPEAQAKTILSALQSFPECDGVFAADALAALSVRLIGQLGRRVPGDVKVIGFDGSSLFRLLNPPLTSVRQPVESIGRYAVEHLARQIEGQSVPNQTTIPCTLIQGETT